MALGTSTTRLVRRVTLGVAVAGTLGALTAAPAFAAKPQHGADPSCTLTATSVGGSLTLAGGGYTPGASYSGAFNINGNQGGAFPIVADSSGRITVSTYAWWAGTYSATVSSGKGSPLAACSTTVS